MFIAARNESQLLILCILITLFGLVLFIKNESIGAIFMIISLIMSLIIDYCVRYKIRKLKTFRKFQKSKN
jgi:uncharacterized membrane protein